MAELKKSNRILFPLALAVFLFPAAARALELSLEENKGQSGTVGFVDIDRVFKDYSGTLAAKEDFLNEIKRKEESVNQRKSGVYALKAEIAKLRQERAFAMTLPSLLATEEQLNRAETAKQQVSTEAVAQPAAAAPEVPRSSGTAAAHREPAVAGSTVPSIGLLSLPGMSPAPAPAAAASSTAAAVAVSTPAVQPAKSPAAAAAPPAADVKASSPPPPAAPAPPETAAAPVVSTSTAQPAAAGVALPGMASVPVNYFKFSVSTAVPEIDAAIAAREADLKQKEDALRLYQRQMEKELLEYEGHRSEILLGRIYVALRELAVREGVSVIVDKRNILFGHSAVDLTDKLLTALEGDR